VPKDAGNSDGIEIPEPKRPLAFARPSRRFEPLRLVCMSVAVWSALDRLQSAGRFMSSTESAPAICALAGVQPLTGQGV
jgi:hypothetical protein